MSTKKIIELITQLDDKGLKELEQGLKKVKKNNEEVDKSAKKASKSLKDVGDNGGAIAILDELTGGLATKVRDAAEASKLFNINLKATRTALIATGIGAFVVALGLVVGYWDEIVDFITGANKQLEEQRILLEQNSKMLEAQVNSIRAEQELRKSRGLAIDDLLKKEAALLKARIKNREETLRTRKEELKLALQRFDEITQTEKFLQFFGKDARTQEDLDKINELKKAALEAKKELLNAQKDLQDLENSIFDANAIVIGAKSNNVTNKVKRGRVSSVDRVSDTEIRQDPLQSPEVISQQQINDILLREKEILNRRLLDLEEERIAEEIRQEKILEKQKIAITAQTLGAISNILGQNTAAGKAFGIAQALINTYQGVTAELATKATTPFDIALKIANVATVLATGLQAVRQIKQVQVPGFSGAQGAAVSQGAPSFNVVGNSGVSQLAQTLQEDQNPVQAFVVSTAVTSQQELDNQIQQTATIG